MPAGDATKPPTQDEIDASFDDSLREIEASLDSNPNLIHCEDITSYDYNWQNDFKCTRPDGSIFYTDEAGARAQDGLVRRPVESTALDPTLSWRKS